LYFLFIVERLGYPHAVKMVTFQPVVPRLP